VTLDSPTNNNSTSTLFSIFLFFQHPSNPPSFHLLPLLCQIDIVTDIKYLFTALESYSTVLIIILLGKAPTPPSKAKFVTPEPPHESLSGGLVRPLHFHARRTASGKAC
jgi:hypothetical protein